MGYDSKIEYLGSLHQVATKISASFRQTKVSDARMALSTFLLVKITLNANSILRLLPNNELYKDQLIKVFDISSVSSLARNLIETGNILYYLSIDTISEVERDFRFSLYELHAQIEENKMLLDFGKESSKTQELTNKIVIKKEELKQNNHFLGLDNHIQKDLLHGRKGFYQSHKEIIVLRGIDLEYFNGVYRYLSNHIHSSPFSINQMRQHMWDGSLDDSSSSFACLIIESCSHFLSYSINDILTIFPERKKSLNESDIILLKEFNIT